LEDLFQKLTSEHVESEEPEPVAKQSFFSFFTKQKADIPERKHSIRGLYMYGGVGTGKTMLMDMFYESVPLTKKKKKTTFSLFYA